MKTLALITLGTAAIFLSSASSQAATNTMTILNGNYAAWDVVPTYSYTDLVPNTGLSGGSTTFTISQSISGPTAPGIPALMDGGDATYSFDKAYSWTINGTAGDTITGFNLQVRHMNSSTLVPKLNIDGTIYDATPYARVADGSYIAVDFSNAVFPVSIDTWSWSIPALSAGDTFSITFAAGSHTAFDAIAIQAIPEPSTYVLIAAGLAGAALLRRRTA